MKNRLYQNYLFNVVYQIVSIVVPIFTAPYIARILNPYGVGVFHYIASIIHVIVIVAGLGTASYGMREVAYVQNDVEKRSRLFWEISLLRLFFVLLAVLLYLVFAFTRKDNQIVYFLMTIQIVSAAFNTSWFFQGLENFKVIAVRNIFVRLTSVIFIFLLVKEQSDLPVYVAIVVLSELIGFGVQNFSLPKYVVCQPIKLKSVLKHLNPSVSLFLPTIAINVYTYLDKVVLGVLSSEKEVGFYSQVEMIIKMSMLVITSLGTVMMPRVANMLSNGLHLEVKNQIVKSCMFVFLLSFPMFVGMSFIAPIFVPLFFGPNYERCIFLMKFMPVIMIVIGLASVTGAAVLIPLKRQRFYTISVVSGAIFNVLLNFILIPTHGSIGAAVATIFAESLVLFLELYFIRDYLLLKKIFAGVKNYLFASFCMGIVLYFVMPYLDASVICNAGFILIGSIVYFTMLILLNDSMLCEVKNKILCRKR